LTNPARGGSRTFWRLEKKRKKLEVISKGERGKDGNSCRKRGNRGSVPGGKETE